MPIQKLGNADLSKIKAFEVTHNIKLPDDYIEFLKHYNGGVIKTTDKNSIII